MKKFNVTTHVTRVIGTQTWEIIAENQEEAYKKWKRGDCDIIDEEISIENIDEPDLEDFVECEEE